MKNSSEQLFFFSGSRDRNLLGFVHWPKHNKGYPGIIYCHPFAEEKNVSHVIVANTARALAESGYPVLRFDMSGCGDSEGELSEVTIDDWLEDIHAAVSWLRNHYKDQEMISLWGLRTGAGLALIYANRFQEKMASLILWQPVLNFKLNIHQFLRRKISSQMVSQSNNSLQVTDVLNEVNTKGVAHIMGYSISKDLYDSFLIDKFQPELISLKCPTLILTFSNIPNAPLSVQKYIDSHKGNNSMILNRHLASEPFWDRYWRWDCLEATQTTLSWMNTAAKGS